MFLVISKLFWLVAEPSSFLLTLWLAGCVLLWTSWRRLGRWLVTITAVVTLAVAIFPIGQLALKPIEDRFPPPVNLPPKVDGIIVLGGVVDDSVMGRRGVPRSVDAAGSPSLDAFLELARRYPMAKHVFTGGSIELINGRDTEADVVRRIFARIGLDTTQMIFEDKSRNTWENAKYSYDLLKPAPDELWIVITLARHMPRSIGCFRKAGWTNLLAYPVDFLTSANGPSFNPNYGLGANLDILGEAIHEYIGLLAYWYFGRTSELFPGP